jgi:hypothetical protein
MPSGSVSLALLQTSRPSAGPLGSSGTHPHGCASRGCWQRPGGRPCLQGWGTHPPKAHAFVVVGALSLTPPLLNRPSSAPRRTAPFASTAWSQHPLPPPSASGRNGAGGHYALRGSMRCRPMCSPGVLPSRPRYRGRNVDPGEGCLGAGRSTAPASDGWYDAEVPFDRFSQPVSQQQPHRSSIAIRPRPFDALCIRACRTPAAYGRGWNIGNSVLARGVYRAGCAPIGS